MQLVAHDHEFIDISAGDYVASISQFGGGPRSLEYCGLPLLTDYPKGFNPPLSAGTLLAPWPNRVADGVFIFGGEVHRLDISEPSRANAIHGFVADRIWTVVDADDSSVTLHVEVEPQSGWPWELGMTVRWQVTATDGLSAEFTVHNRSDRECPFGLGWHPYLSALGADFGSCTLRLPVDKNLPLEPIRNLPAGPAVPAETVVPSLREGVSLDGLWLDHCFFVAEETVESDSPRRREAHLIGPSGKGAVLWADDEFRFFQVYVADAGRREGFPGHGNAIAVEPMTCPPDALRSGTGLLRLQAGETKTLAMGLRAETDGK
ncbi:aldose 1-epimerase family protein [Corynebacterium amycolatum]|uniref:Aldose 1-epimerase family protein n=1 Tax=Corynebacterium amycolatum TaxID=43765 RepID=A0AB37G968_CORAY|nr:aldose 1-epimerase family protein [Corynebacterium amycolatum]MCQ9124796.1 aldose 1-epimerase family protein [Corynebacterium amycolatum]MCQ9128402.1 aldose 1-epimerase family protein [Corynebacterium amycolatum]MCQ9142382.1 aldose 1-epimerase family protein [Corynebacterium amycolatum]MCQ9169574.1 aldose 1-epimerase family protein [Corynebacterium amycolatum]MCQ9175698.1 aldose 1-epimerase family protein [Corynebacterium amycolatum]